ncbi:MAG: FtsQ-type POTRA domain-containing protein [Chloroflexi bacterium]|nr:FtsQ-type POTRA domain-containing protein [Chloroflexota bacterium]
MSEKRELTRAEIVRMRRRQQAQKRETRSYDLATRPLPPITTRMSTPYTAPRRAASTRRRMQASLSMPGVHVQMPTITMPRFEVGWRLFSFFLALAMAAAIFLAWNLSVFRVVAAQVQGNQRISANEINAVLNAAGQPIFTLMPTDLATRLRLNYPELASAKVTLGLPNLVTVNVVERQPVILWQINGGYTWIDDNGVAFRPRGNADNLISVAALGAPAPGSPSQDDLLSPIPYMSTDMVKAIKLLAPDVPAGATLTYDPQYGLGWTDSRGWRVVFGNSSNDMPLKWQVYQSLVNSLLQQGIKPAFISVQYVNAPYYRMSQ